MTLRIEDVSRCVRDASYAVRGPIVARADQLERAGRRVTYCNIGNPQAFDQRPITFVRRVLALAEDPGLLELLPPGTFAEDVVATARTLVQGSRHGLGAYTESKGYRFVREAVAAFIAQRDGIVTDADHIFLTDGASKAVQSVLRLLVSGEDSGVMVPVPQYPLYAASLTLLGAHIVPYELDEDRGWTLTDALLEASLQDARARGIRVRGLVVINPGNPSGGVLSQDDVATVLTFAARHGIPVLADEVYQENVHVPDARFVSFAHVRDRLRIEDLPLFSFHSTSKGLFGECGHRGGYVECRGVPDAVLDELTKLQSIALCSNSVGQVVTYLMVRPPVPGSPSYAQFHAECEAIREALRAKAKLVSERLNAVPGISCVPVQGALYAFPKITLPAGVTDGQWCMALLDDTGICVVPGTGFGQRAGTSHFRTTLLPPMARLEEVLDAIGAFHRAFTARH